MHRTSGCSDRHVRELVAENSEFKKFHEQIKRDVKSILARHEVLPLRGLSEESLRASKRSLLGRSKNARPTDNTVTGSLRKQWSSLKQLVESLEVRASEADTHHVIRVTDHEKELTKLRKEMEELHGDLEKSKELINHQQQLLQEQLIPVPAEGEASPLWDAYFIEEQLKLQQDREAFEEQKRAFQDEREKFTEAAIRLGRERIQFKADQALYVKQQFLSTTPGLGTPAWKKTPPWTALTTDTPPGSTNKPRPKFTPSSTNNHRKKGSANDQFTPSTAELYRVLRLAPPTRAALASQKKTREDEKEDSEWEESKWWNESSYPQSESPEPQNLLQAAFPLKLSMTPYLRPRPSPLSLPSSRCDSKTPCTTELYRKMRLSSTDSVSGQKRCNSQRRTSLKREYGNYDDDNGSVCVQERSRRSARPRASYETDSSNSRDSRKSTMENGGSSGSDKDLCPPSSSESFEKDSLYKAYSMHDSGTSPYERVNHEHKRDSLYSTYGTGDALAYLPSKVEWSYDELEYLPTQGTLNGKDNSQNHLRGTNYQRDNEISLNKIHTSLHSMNQSRSVHIHKEACKIQPRKTHHTNENCRSCSRDGRPPSDRCRSQSKHVLHPKSSKHYLSRENLHPQDVISCSLHRSPCQHRDSLYTSCPKRSPQPFHSCPRETPAWNSSSTPSHICADLLNQFLDCCS
ncbi:hypothetical protein GDO86_006977 [Hymenochirus boettgeri]|uniref:Uncharacterized protein n=1 Tax=Hymenochirus boettgeri TaxID=247094 RepID=A0A8T2JD00_9PIPI|nr:hypothetical protein GDO86_006977 [Hymenochirus boettgeri]